MTFASDVFDQALFEALFGVPVEPLLDDDVRVGHLGPEQIPDEAGVGGLVDDAVFEYVETFKL